MKTHLSLMLAATFAAVVSPAAADPGRTVAVLRNRPLAISPAPVVPRTIHRYTPSVAASYYRRAGALRAASQFGSGGLVPFGFHGIPAGRNGYVGGLANLPHIVVDIPPAFGKAGPWPAPRPQFLIPNHHGGGRPGGGFPGGGRPGGGRPGGPAGGAKGK
jgi:hypothetical protein